MRKLQYLSVALFCLLAIELSAQEVIPLYPGEQIPFAKEGGEVPTLTVFQPKRNLAKGTAVIVCSGGSYGGRANRVEGIPACNKLMEAGITAFLLNYRLPKAEKMERKEIVPLTDAQRAIQYVREHAGKYKIDPSRLGIMGFSAGGHLASTVGTHFTKSELDNPKGTSLRPDFMVLVYPVISFADSLTHKISRMNLLGPEVTPEEIREYSNELHVTPQTPPTYITSGMDDKIVDVKNSLYFSAALRQCHVPVALFLYEKGRHGYGVANNQAQVQWIDDCIQWIRKERQNNRTARTEPLKAPLGLMCDLSGEDVEPVRIFNKIPAFSWELPAEKKSLAQTAYQLLVSDDLDVLNRNVGNVWDSGKIMSSGSAGVLFKSMALKPNTRYYWKVKVWNSRKEESPYSGAVSFLTGETLSAYKNPAYPLKITEQKPLSLKENGKVYQADFGKDAFAQLKLQLSSKFGGDTVTIRLGEILDANGNIDRKPPGKIRYAQYFLVLQKGTHTYKLNLNKDIVNTRPAAIKMPGYIGEVTPYRYCEIEGYKQLLQKESLTRLFVHYKFDDEGASFHSSDSTLNAIWDLCKYSIKATSFLGMYVDGDRERIPYEADAYINQLSHYAVDKEFTMARNSHEYLITNPTWPTEWNLQSVLIAWNDYMYTGDIRSLAHYYKDLQAKTLLSLTDSTGLISTLNGRLNNDVKASIHLKNATLKDIVDWPRNTETDGFVFTKYNAVVNAFHYRALVVMEQIAKHLGKTADAAMYRKSAARVKAAFQKMFFDTTKNVFVDGMGTDHASLHANAFALALGLVNARDKHSVMAFIRSKGMACSVYGSQFLLDGVYDACDGDYGLSLLTSKTDRSWFNMIRVGSTITLEAWDNKYKPNQDWNHAWGAAPANIISRKLMGIEPITPGWASFSVKPQMGGLVYASITVPTVKGKIKVACTQKKERFVMDVEIPGNTLAQVHLPLKNERRYEVLLDGNPIRTTRVNQAVLVKNVGPGKHTLHIIYKN